MSDERLEQIRHIVGAMIDMRELCDSDVTLISQLVFALTWSKESAELAYKQMEPVVALNNKERTSHL